MSEICLDPEIYYFPKPIQWKFMSMWEKISYYKNILGKQYAPFVDKLIAKDIVKQVCGERIEVAKVIRILSSPDDINKDDLKENYILKASHGSGWNIPLNPSLSLDEIKNKLNSWNIRYTGIKSGESQYQYLQPRFFIEEVIDDINFGKNAQAQVFMIRCIQGKPITISVRRGELQNSYDIRWNPIESEVFEIKKPAYLFRMLDIAERLSAPFEFVRIDLYISSNNKIFFSEYTFTPAGGTQIFQFNLEKQFGALWL